MTNQGYFLQEGQIEKREIAEALSVCEMAASTVRSLRFLNLTNLSPVFKQSKRVENWKWKA
ncbi:hypothetical protein CEF21_03780 [Bacillus sp. FJAT-42376]|nr:hypothetical protein CEF21_03780 [Bacillus sp. FJAT-42376]